MKSMGASEFKAKCLAVIDEVADSGERVIISKRGVPVADLVPHVSLESGYAQETLRGTVRILGDIEAPVVPGSAWESVKPQ